MIWPLLLACCLSRVAGNKTDDRTPSFHGHVLENRPVGSRVNGLSIPARRIDAQRRCSGSGAFLKLLGDGSADFRVFTHHGRGHVVLKTASVLDREDRADYALDVGLCCGRCVSVERVVATIRVDVLDTNDHEPAFRHSDVKIALDDATALRSVVYKVTAEDTDTGKNAELIYYSLPRNGSFYVVPKTGDVLLVDSILGLGSPIQFSVFARDRGSPARTGRRMRVQISPRQWPAALPATPRIRTKYRRSVLETGEPVTVSVSEDAAIGSVIVNLNPVRFPAASFEMIYPDAEDSPVSVSRDTGELLITRNLDRETEPVVEVTVKVQDKRGKVLSRCVLIILFKKKIQLLLL